MQTHTFNKEATGWYIDLPEYLIQGGSQGDLAMVEGADTMWLCAVTLFVFGDMPEKIYVKKTSLT